MAWSVETLDHRVDAELDALSADMQASFYEIAALLEEFGPQRVSAPHIKHLTGKLWEIRMRGRDGIARAIYVFAKEQRIVVVHAFVKKTQKTPKDAIKTAKQRAKDVQ